MGRKQKNNGPPVCGFCGRPQQEVGMLVEGKLPSHYICNMCTRLSLEILERESQRKTRRVSLMREVPIPREIVSTLDKFIIGQLYAKRVLAVSVYNHYKRIMYIPASEDDVELTKSNVLLIGKTGVGKTALVQALAKIIKVPLAIGDATTLTEAGYVGDDVESLLVRLLHAANMDIEITQMGIIYIDELDKLARSQGNVSITRDVSGEGVQQGLLKMLEGTVASVPPQGGRKHPEQKCIDIDTTNILFICGGTFVGLEDIIASRLGKKRIGFGDSKDDSDEDNIKSLLSEDLVSFGFIPELVGRLPVVASLHDLDESMLLRVLVEPKNSLVKQYQKMAELEDCELEFTQEALLEIAKTARKEETGARGLRGVVDRVMLDIMFGMPERSVRRFVITDKMVRQAIQTDDSLNIGI